MPANAMKCEELNPEKVAYWYLRLNGFLQIEDFYVHPSGKGGARTDADLLAVRFPHRKERLYDSPSGFMDDDDEHLAISRDYIDVVIAEVKAGRCALNGPWTNPDKKNVERVLAAIGCLPDERIDRAADTIYRTGFYVDDVPLRIRLIAIGRELDTEIQDAFPQVQQIIWSDLLGFVFERHQEYRHQKRQTDHWDTTGKLLKRKATSTRIKRDEFIDWAIRAMGINGLKS